MGPSRASEAQTDVAGVLAYEAEGYTVLTEWRDQGLVPEWDLQEREVGIDLPEGMGCDDPDFTGGPASDGTVKIMGSDGAIVGLGHLEPRGPLTYTYTDTLMGQDVAIWCEFEFTVPGVPTNIDFYTVEIDGMPVQADLTNSQFAELDWRLELVQQL